MRNKITLARAKEAFNYNPATGVFTWKISRGRVKIGDVAGTNGSHGYRIIGIDGAYYFAHRLAWFFTHGYWPVEVDHKNGEPADNRISNLRDSTRQLNLHNQRRPQKRNKCGLLGVSYSKRRKKWRAQIAIDGRGRDIGYYDTPEEAHAAYVAEKRKIHSFCTI